MRIVEVILILLAAAAGAGAFAFIAWTHRLKHVFPKRGEIKIVNPGGLWSGIAEVVFQTKVIANRPVAGFFHLLIFYGFVSFGAKSATHFLNGVLGLEHPIPLGPLDYLIDVMSVLVLAGVVFMAIRRYTVMRQRLTHMLESGLVLLLIGTLMLTYIMERPWGGDLGLVGTAAKVNWWVHFLILCGFPSLIAYGKHFHLLMGPINVVLKHMVEKPGDRFVSGGDFDMGDDDATEEDFEAELARVGMPNGVSDFSFHTLFDPAACIECGRCNDACPSADAGLKPRDHFVLAFRNPATTGEQLAELAPPDIISTCTQCRACDTVCPVGNRPSKAGLELRGRMTADGIYPPPALKETGANPVGATGNIFAADPSDRATFIEENEIPIFDHGEHDVLFALGCQGSYSPEGRKVVVATSALLKAAGVKFGVLEDETCWGEGLLHGGGIFEEWPVYKEMQVEALDMAMDEKRDKLVLTICPHCRDNIGVQLSAAAEKMGKSPFDNVVSHVGFLSGLVGDGKLKVSAKAEEVAVHHPCKTIHHDEQGTFDGLLKTAGVTGKTAGDSPRIPRCCGGGGGGFLWDSPAKVSKNRFQQIMAETHQKKIVTGCPGCHRMLTVAKDEETELADIAVILQERVEGAEPTAR
ncbi:MAG: 4Fe-4S dicluster domain-containing protein [Alphaproteobacteria bacterium]|nr:4Fe-4S dicluster domain-containing protein [Alphaproteobacteria bacterium]